MNEFDAALAAKIDGKLKPPGALGRLEHLAAQAARLQRRFDPVMERARLVIFAADHGLVAEGVSAYPAEVTRQMVQSFAAGRAAANVFARQAGLDMLIVNAGVRGGTFAHDAVRELGMGSGTASSLHGPAMTRGQVDAALTHGERIGAEGAWDALAVGEMGIGNTSAAALIAHRLTGAELSTLVGRGAGLDDAGLMHKHAVLESASARVPGRLGPREALAEFGGFEIVMMAGAMIGAARAGRMVLVDGFISSAAALSAAQIAPETRAAMVFSHLSEEPGHAVILDAMGARPLLSLGMRLGEGTGAALAWPMLRAAVAMLNEMASFEDAGVSGPAGTARDTA
jgi:nicotinate-nucleotide--dimethylbenzimidazole phosphoribosyltransferase